MQLDTPVTKFISALCAILLLVIGIEWLSLGSRFVQSEASLTPQEPITASSLSKLSLLNASEGDHAKVFAEPLFTEGRIPVEAKIVVNGKTRKGKDDNKSAKISLVGVSLSKNNSLVLLQDNKGKYHRLIIGDKLQGWTLKAIQSNRVTLYSAGKKKTLELEKHKTVHNNKESALRPPQSVPSKPRIKKLPLHHQGSKK